MRTHRLVISLLQTHATTKFACALIALIVLTCLPVRVPAQTTCTGTFAGDWSWQQGPDKLTISLQGDTAEGVLRSWKLKGTVTNGVLAGDWVDQLDPAESGTFRVDLFSAEHRIRVSLYNKQKLIHSSDFFCQPAQSPQTTGPAGFPGFPFPWPKPGGLSDDDTDNFQKFDALPKAEQEKRLVKKGPRLPLEYDVSDLSLRVLVRGGSPVLLDYGLDSDAFAQLSIEVEGAKPLFMKIDSAKRAQLRITIPDDFGARPQVAKVRITASTANKEPADFRLYGIGMGEKGVAALKKAIGSDAQLAMSLSPGKESGYDRLPLFAPKALPTGSAIQLRVDPPSTIKLRQKPKKKIAFSLTSQSDFSNGRWEIRLVRGRKWLKVWEKNTGTILPNRTKSNTWDGIIHFNKADSLGSHALKVTAWHGRESAGDWVIAQTDPDLIVIE